MSTYNRKQTWLLLRVSDASHYIKNIDIHKQLKIQSIKD